MNRALVLFLCIIINLSIKCNIYVNSIPKCGTHLLTKALHLITGIQPQGFKTVPNFEIPKLSFNETFFCHMPYSIDFEQKLINQSIKAFFIYRDPRDQVVSNAFWLREKDFRYKAYGYKKVPTLNELITLLISYVDNTYKKQFGPWFNNKNVCEIKFENLIGPRGRGNLKLQKKELKKICNFIGIKKPRINYCIKNLFGDTGTFRKGEIGQWRQHFTDTQKNKFKKVAGQLLVDLGYEKDLNW